MPPPPPKKRQRKEPKENINPSPEGPHAHGKARLDAIAGQDVLEETPHTEAKLPARPAEPQQTNAVLETPRGSRVVRYPKEALDKSPSKTTPKDMPVPTSDTNRLLTDGIAHLIKVEPRLKPIIDAHHCHVFSPEGLAEPVDPFRSLSSSILGQQVSGAAAAAIKRRFVALFFPDEDPEDKSKGFLEGKFPTPQQVVQMDISKMRGAGLSQRKAEYIQGLAEKFAAGELSARMLLEASYDEVLEKLVAVRGLGKWTVEMFACFGLKRMDVFSTGDLGVQRGMAAFQGRDVNKLKNKKDKWKYMSEADMLETAEKFVPYKSLFMWYMWQVADVNVDAIKDA